MSTDDETRDFHSQLRQAWIDTSLERDRSILTLASGGIGVLFIIADKLALETQLLLVLFVGSLLGFLVAVLAAVWIFHENRAVLRAQLRGEAGDRLAGMLDKMMIGGFVAGLLMSCTLTFVYAVESYSSHKRKDPAIMSDEVKKEVDARLNSLNGIFEIRPVDGEGVSASFHDIKDIAPTPQPPPAQTPPAEKKE